jgi:hypothetical protein
VVATAPSSGVFVRPMMTMPASRYRRVMFASVGCRYPASFMAMLPKYSGSPALDGHRSFMTMGNPRNGPSGSAGVDATRPIVKSFDPGDRRLNEFDRTHLSDCHEGCLGYRIEFRSLSGEIIHPPVLPPEPCSTCLWVCSGLQQRRLQQRQVQQRQHHTTVS